jgi:uncharacterized protein YkwD
MEVFVMMKHKILAVGLTAVLTLGASVPAWADVRVAVYSPGETIVISQDTPALFTDEELSALAAIAPAITETRSAMTMPGRCVTAAELTAWSDEYWELGGINAFELEVVRLINIERRAAGLHPLALNPTLSMAARFHSHEMADLVFFSHRSPHHGRGTYRAEMFGHVNIQEHVWGAHENIASTTRSPERAVYVWMNSPGHRAALLGEHFLTIGIGAVPGGGTTAKFGS